MELRAGYKQTEVGIVPEEWAVVSVQKLVEENILEKPLDGNHGNIHPKSSDYVDHGIPFVMANNFHDGQVDLLGCKFITKQRADKLQKGFSIFRDVLLTHKGTVGSTAVVGELSTDYIMLTPQVTYYRVRDEDRLNNQFLRQYFDSQPFQSLFISLAGGGTRAYLGIVKQLALPVIRPPIEEQRAIAAVLSDVDSLLGGMERLIAKKRDLKQAAMQQLLTGQTRLPGFSGEWEVKRLGDVADVIDPHPSHRAPDEVTNGVPFVGIGDLDESGNVVGKKVRLVDFAVLEEHALRYNLRDELIGLGRVASIGKVVSLKSLADGYAISPTLGVIRGREAKRSYLLYALKSRFVTDQFTKIMSGSTRSSVGMEVLRELQITLPPSEQEQTAIATVLSDMDAELSALAARRDKTRDLKQAMMQELLTGKTRLVARRDPVETLLGSQAS